MRRTSLGHAVPAGTRDPSATSPWPLRAPGDCRHAALGAAETPTFSSPFILMKLNDVTARWPWRAPQSSASGGPRVRQVVSVRPLPCTSLHDDLHQLALWPWEQGVQQRRLWTVSGRGGAAGLRLGGARITGSGDTCG